MLYAHTKEGMPEREWQHLDDHLCAVAQLAGKFAASFGTSEWAHLLGEVHDLGKASNAFQQYLRSGKGHVDHSTFGGQLLTRQYKDFGRLLAFAACGHHGGMPNGYGGEARSSLDERLEKEVEPVGYDAVFDDLPSFKELLSDAPKMLFDQAPSDCRAFTLSFLVRMLYSTLVDADFLDTERFVSPQRAALRDGRGLSLEQMRAVLSNHMFKLGKGATTPVNEARADIHEVCILASHGKPGIYTLTVPTGGGKTLSSLAFALEHALENGQQRIVYAIPFTSIIEQTADTFKSLFGPDSVLEHHSAYEYHEEEGEDGERFVRERLSMENWDVPLVVTTNVQLFESLFADKPSRCRKNHNLANSVIILDEAQSIPDNVLTPCLAALEELAAHYGTTVVLCTATQPALDAVWPFPVTVTDIVPESRRHTKLFDSRVKIEDIGEQSEEAIAKKVREHNQVLCVVSTRKAAREIYDRLAMDGKIEGLFHLSALMVPAHRSAVISQIRRRLDSGLQCVVVSTQLIEAGVDIDFPVVYREIAGIDSVKQSAGRCNREGREEIGHVYVFDCPETKVSMRWLGQMRSLGQETVSQVKDPFGDEGVRYFFGARYQVQDTDSLGIMKTFANPKKVNSNALPFETCGRVFHLVDSNSVNVFVPWGEEGMHLLDSLRQGDIDIEELRKIQRYSVGVAPWQLEKLEDSSAIAQEGNLEIWTLEPYDGKLENYSDERGLCFEEDKGACVI